MTSQASRRSPYSPVTSAIAVIASVVAVGGLLKIAPGSFRRTINSGELAVGAGYWGEPDLQGIWTDKTDFQGSRENLHLVERWTRLDENTLDYVVTSEDGTTWTRPWTPRHELKRQNNKANEGNFGMIGLLTRACGGAGVRAASRTRSGDTLHGGMRHGHRRSARPRSVLTGNGVGSSPGGTPCRACFVQLS